MSRIKIIRTSAIEEFANSVHIYKDQLYRLWLISPWIGQYTDGTPDPLQMMIDSLRTKPSCVVTVITRPPQAKADYHRKAIKLLRDNVRPLVFFCDILHTKLYVIEGDGITVAIMGSPNLTAGGNSANLELALELRAISLELKDVVSSTLRDIVGYAQDLLREDSVKLVH